MKNKKMKFGMYVLAIAFCAQAFSGVTVSAWGPERPTYTMAKPADHAVFNSITDNAAVGDERDFVRIAEKREDGSAIYGNEVTVEPNKQYEVYIYFHNDASSTYNESKYNNIGIAWNTRLSSSFPTELSKDQRAAVTGRITSTSTSPEAVWDEAYVTASAGMTLHYMPATARIYSDPKWATNGEVLPTSLFSSTGTFLGLLSLNGTIPGCDEYSGYVIYTIQTYLVDEPEEPVSTPEPTPESTKPEVPQELPETGPAEVALAIVVMIAIIAGFVYWRKTSHAVRKATRSAKGRGGKRK